MTASKAVTEGVLDVFGQWDSFMQECQRWLETPLHYLQSFCSPSPPREQKLLQANTKLFYEADCEAVARDLMAVQRREPEQSLSSDWKVV